MNLWILVIILTATEPGLPDYRQQSKPMDQETCGKKMELAQATDAKLTHPGYIRTVKCEPVSQ